MKRYGILALAVAVLVTPAAVQAGTCDANDQYTDLAVLYVDDHTTNPSEGSTGLPAPFIYAETNGVAGLQRVPPNDSPNAPPGETVSSDGSGHCGYTDGDSDLLLL